MCNMRVIVVFKRWDRTPARGVLEMFPAKNDGQTVRCTRRMHYSHDER